MKPTRRVKKHYIVDNTPTKQEIIERINSMIKIIDSGSRNSPSNWIVCSSEVANTINTILK